MCIKIGTLTSCTSYTNTSTVLYSQTSHIIQDSINFTRPAQQTLLKASVWSLDFRLLKAVSRPNCDLSLTPINGLILSVVNRRNGFFNIILVDTENKGILWVN